MTRDATTWDERPPTPGRGASKGERHAAPGAAALFYRQVVAELRKVIWPTRAELITYTTVVIVFVLAITAIVGRPRLRVRQGRVLHVFGD